MIQVENLNKTFLKDGLKIEVLKGLEPPDRRRENPWPSWESPARERAR